MSGRPIVKSLFWLDASDNKIKPLLALSYVQETPTAIVVKLRPDVKFTNGEPMNADAVIFSFNILIDPKQTPAYTRYFEGFSKATKIDDLTVRMETKYPIPPMELTLSLFFVVPPKYWTEVGLEAYGRKPIGTGPFVFESWTRDAAGRFEEERELLGNAAGGHRRTGVQARAGRQRPRRRPDGRRVRRHQQHAGFAMSPTCSNRQDRQRHPGRMPSRSSR